MNPIGLVLDVLLLCLLGWALGLGLKLNGRLKALRDGQAGFAKAVAELDVASRRAEAGLADMRRAAEETHDALSSRIEAARQLIARLEMAAQDAVSRAPSVSALRAEPRPPREERSPVPPARAAGGLPPAKRVTGGASSRAPALEPAEPAAPAGFADMIRRTLRDAR